LSAKTQINKNAKINNIEAEVNEKEHICQTCGKSYKKRQGSFTPSKSPLYAGSDGYINTCKVCIDKLFQQYTDFYKGSEEKAIERICEIFDLYFNENALAASRKISEGRSRINSYIAKINISPHTGKAFSDTIIERANSEISSIEKFEDLKEKNFKVQQKTIKFFGLGFTEEEYQQMATQYDDWISRHECKTKAQEELFKNICIIQLQIQKATKNGDKIDPLMKTYQDLLGSANLKPTQTNENTIADQNAFGTLIRKWEEERPISDPNPEWKDVDGIRKYINVWFLGHLCKMMGIRNSYSQEYEDEIAKFKVEKPEYVDEDENDNPALDEMFKEGI
jgi:hypothetical protein